MVTNERGYKDVWVTDSSTEKQNVCVSERVRDQTEERNVESKRENITEI